MTRRFNPISTYRLRLIIARLNLPRAVFNLCKRLNWQTIHTLMGTDICFWDEMTSPLFDLLTLARSAGTEQILIADPGRPPFWDLAERCVAELGAEIITRRIYEPWKTEKFILAIGGRD